MDYRSVGLFCALFLFLPFSPSSGETLQLRSGREVEIIDGRVPDKVAAELLREASALQKSGQLDLAREFWQLLANKTKGPLAARAAAAREKIQSIEYSSVVVLKNGIIAHGKITANLRADLLGLEGKEEIPLWQIEEIVAEYHPGYSAVSKTYYPLTLLEIKFRSGERQTSRTMAEIEFAVAGTDGSLQQMILGSRYEILRPQDVGEQIDARTQDRIMKVMVYAELKKSD
ncbi:MAG: hypothetical protein OEN50_10010 [Deltaproteobacteria bacterium]|nr:hypothetical protein [Deltaproteobacteria bacterium]